MIGKQRGVWNYRWFVLLLFAVPAAPAFSLAAGSDRVSFDVYVQPKSPGAGLSTKPPATKSTTISVKQGETFTVVVNGKVKPGFHTYPVKKLAPKQEDYKTDFEVRNKQMPGFVVGDVRETEPILVNEKELKQELYEYTGAFVFERDIQVKDVKPGEYKLPVYLFFSLCDAKGCKFLKDTTNITVQVAAGDSPSPGSQVIPPPPTDKPKTPEAKKTEKTGNETALISGSTEQYQSTMDAILQRLLFLDNAQNLSSSGLLGFLLAGVFFGAISLITPCVFPMIPITVSFFLKQSEKEHHKPVAMAAVYSATIVIVLTTAAVAFLGVFRALSINPYMNIIIGGLLVFFALSLLGWYDIELPSGLARLTSSREGAGGLIGTIFMALTFTIISFACVAPFLGGFGSMVQSGVPLWHIVLGGLAFAITFAAPFFVLALFPSLLKRMPKSGSWLNSVKVVMGFLELAAALKFFRTAELVGTSAPSIFTFDLVLGIWVAICLLTALYLLGVFRLPHDDESRPAIGVPRMLWAVGFLGLGLYLMPALFKNGTDGRAPRPAGTVYAWVDSFLLPDASKAEEGNGSETGNLHAAIAQAEASLKQTGQSKLIFVDFTGFSCTNCKLNERDVFGRPEIRKLFDPYIVVKLYTDKIPASYYAPGVGADLFRQQEDAGINLDFQKKAFGDVVLPLYAVLEAKGDGKIAVLGTVKGRIFEENAFAEFLRSPAGKKIDTSVAQN